MKPRLVAMVAALGALTGCYAVHGDGVPRLEQRNVGDFHAFHVGWGFQAVATLGSPARVTIEGDSNVVATITTSVSGGDLRIDLPERTVVIPVLPVRITLVSPTLTAIEASGGAQVTAETAQVEAFDAEASGGSKILLTGLDAQSLRAEGSGGSALTVKGLTLDAKLLLSGGSQLHGTELTAQTIRIEGSGGSSGTVHASHSVTGALSGGSHLMVLGHPQVSVETSGGSSVTVQD